MEPRLVNLIFAVIQSDDHGDLSFPHYPLEEIGSEALGEVELHQRPGLLGEGDDERKEDCYQDALSVFFNSSGNPYPTFSFPDCDKIELAIAEIREAYDENKTLFSGYLATTRALLHQATWLDTDHDERYQDLVCLCFQLVYTQERARGDAYLVKYGQDLLTGVHRYNRLTAGGPYPRDPQGSLQVRIFELLCNLVGVLPVDFFWVDDPAIPFPNVAYFEQARFEYQFFLRLKLRAALSESEFHLECSDTFRSTPDHFRYLPALGDYDRVVRFERVVFFE
jgi:hypothetical protein